MASALQKFAEWVKENHAQQPSLGAEVRAMGRELIKDVRASLHDTAWGRPEHMPELGTPLNPTQKIITDDLKNKDIDHEL
jgi:hypothetical protein